MNYSKGFVQNPKNLLGGDQTLSNFFKIFANAVMFKFLQGSWKFFLKSNYVDFYNILDMKSIMNS